MEALNMPMNEEHDCNEKKDNMGAKIVNWVKKNRVKIGVTVLGAAATVALTYFFSGEDEEENSLVDNLLDMLRNGSKYSRKWIEDLTDEEWKDEREKVRLEYCSCGNDYSRAQQLESILSIFDQVYSAKVWGDEEPQGPAFHREHGWYLENDD